MDIRVDTDACVGCGLCVKDCPMHVYELQNNVSVPVRPNNCMGCLSCHEICRLKHSSTVASTLLEGTISTLRSARCSGR
jgi:NAD-dependent dihydropyrimidine dehydrogenase PreA subunit